FAIIMIIAHFMNPWVPFQLRQLLSLAPNLRSIYLDLDDPRSLVQSLPCEQLSSLNIRTAVSIELPYELLPRFTCLQELSPTAAYFASSPHGESDMHSFLTHFHALFLSALELNSTTEYQGGVGFGDWS
ncbi:hypothetical protein H0H93_015643, partial [Arthromyces matolae]